MLVFLEPALTCAYPGVQAAHGRLAQVDAAMLREVLRRHRAGMRGEIGGRADDRHAHIGSDADRHHVLGDAFAEADAGVVTLFDNIGESCLDVQFDMDVGIGGQQSFERGPENVMRGVLGRL